MVGAEVELSWSVEQRLQFLEYRLFWEGGLNRSDIIDEFSVSIPQASKDLSLYQTLAPENLRYDKSEKSYFAADGFKPLFIKPDAETYLSHLMERQGRRASAGRMVEGNVISEGCPLPTRKIAPDILRAIVAAVRTGKALEIEYQSMNPRRPGPEWRTISPHAFASDGLRWHVRAYCHESKKFKDFILARVRRVREADDAGHSARADRLWHEVFEVVLEPNPALTSEQRQAIALDFDMKAQRISVPVRKAMLFYFSKRLRLDLPASAKRAEETPVVVRNAEQFAAALSEAIQ